MLVWGKLCAILCTSAWFYFVPRLRSEDSVSNGLISAESFYDSEEYKKKVVMDGFLERSRRSISWILMSSTNYRILDSRINYDCSY